MWRNKGLCGSDHTPIKSTAEWRDISMMDDKWATAIAQQKDFENDPKESR